MPWLKIRKFYKLVTCNTQRTIRYVLYENVGPNHVFLHHRRRQSFFKRSKRFKRFKRFKRKNVDDEGNRKKYKNTEKQHENGKYDKWVVLIKPHNGCDAFRILIRNCK